LFVLQQGVTYSRRKSLRRFSSVDIVNYCSS